MERLANELRQKLDEVTVQKVVIMHNNNKGALKRKSLRN